MRVTISPRRLGVPELSLDESAHLNAPSAFGAYRVLHQIGSGVLGPVFRTYEPQHDRLVAVKAFRLELVPEDVERFAEALRRLVDARVTHPGMVPVLDAGMQNGTAYIAMEYIAGETLDVAFRHLAPASLGRALPILSAMAGAIDAAWAAGFGHGALHPRDVFFRAGSDEVSVTGFGVMPALEAVGFKPQPRRPYAAPERANGGPATLAADVYSLGAVAHELLTRRRPGGSGEQDGEFASSVSERYRAAVGRMLSVALAAAPEERYPTAQAFVTALASIDDRAPVPAMAPGPLFEQIEQIEPEQIEHRPQASDPEFDTMAIRRRDGLADLHLTPVPVQSNWEAALDRQRTPLPAAEFPPDTAGAAAEPVKPDMERPPARAREWDFPAETQDAAAAESLSRDRRPLPQALFASVAREPLGPAPFPWAALVAVALAALTVGGVGGYVLGSRARPAVAVTPPPMTTDLPRAPATPPATPPPTAGEGGATATGSGDAAAKPPASSTPAAPTTGRLAVHSVPTGALITLDGKSRGSAPQTMTDLPLGTYTVKVARSGYSTASQQVVLSAEDPSRNITVTLERPSPSRASRPAASASTAASAKTGILVIDTLPKGATVTIDGKPAGTTPARATALTPGAHSVRIQLSGYKTIATSVTIKAGATEKLSRSMERSGG